ncbi:MAG: hypothetical protein HOP28_15345 [Gemmatimonadales bacterium]|nr:hypothetical protein [Gemmatimonadales bacterium]
MSTGVIVVGDGKSLELRLFSSAGKVIGASGRRGGGPGEFQRIEQIQRCAGDSLFVFDPALFRMSVFSPSGEYVRAAGVREWLSNGMKPYDFWCNPAGTIAFVNRTPELSRLLGKEGPLRPPVEILLVGRNDSVISLGRFPGSEMYFRAPAAGPRHLGMKTTIAVGSNSVYVGTGDTFEVTEFSLRGARLRTLGDSRALKEVTAAQVTSYIDEFIAGQGGTANASGLRQYFRELEWPKVYPAYRRLVIDWSDNLWIEEYPVPGRGIHDWTIYGKSGALIATITLPAGLRLLEAGRDYVLGVSKDTDDVEYVRMYGIVR